MLVVKAELVLAAAEHSRLLEVVGWLPERLRHAEGSVEDCFLDQTGLPSSRFEAGLESGCTVSSS